MSEFYNVQTERISAEELKDLDRAELILIILNLESEKINTETQVRIAERKIASMLAAYKKD